MYYRDVVVVTLAYLKISLAFHIHLYNSNPVGSLVYNASHGVGWLYRWDPSTLREKSAVFENWLRLDQKLGHVTLRRRSALACDTFTVHVEARTVREPTNYTMSPLTIHLHGDNCQMTDVDSSSYEHTTNDFDAANPNVHLVAIVLTADESNNCLNGALNLRTFFPIASTYGCKLEIYNNSRFHINAENGALIANDELCMQNPYELIYGYIMCGLSDVHNGKMPFKIFLYYSSIRRMSFIDYKLSQSTDDIGVRQRLRREASNHPPSFQQGSYAKSVPEEQPAGYVIGTITASDRDTGAAGSITYSLLATRDGRSQSMFAVDPGSGKLTTAKKLDREVIATHYLQIIATDNGSPQLSGIAALTITVDDINDHTPLFELKSYSQSVSESVSVGSTILTVRANDQDSGPNAEIQYSIINQSGANEAFRIDPRRGTITTRRHLDREQYATYELRVKAVDSALLGGRNSATVLVTITVLDENDNKPQFTQASYTVDVREDVDPADSPVIAVVKAIDADHGQNSRVSYSIRSGNSQRMFSIDSLSGQISLRKALDYETVTSYRLSIRAQDAGSPRKSNSTTLLVNVIDVNDNSPKFFPTIYEKSVLEGIPTGYSILTVRAFDHDSGINKLLHYSLLNPPKNLPITIDSNTGTLSSSGVLDREEQARYTFTVQVKDGGTPSLSATAHVQITLRDINDNSPVFKPKVYSEVIAEEANVGTPVVVLTASDADEGENARISYAISSGNTKGTFNIISQMGQGVITVARELNYKEQKRYILLVTATDTGNLVDTATVYVNVSDTNTHHPVFAGTPYVVRVEESTPIGVGILTVVAHDNDDGENARITYRMDENDVFQIAPNTGEIRVKSTLDREKTGGYTFSVSATDHGRPPKSDTTDVEIIIIDVNDNAPKFKQSSYAGRISEDSTVGTSILTILADDIDQGVNGLVRYTFEGGNSGDGDFSLDPTLGILRTAKPLDRERIAMYELKAYAIDRGIPEQSTQVTIHIAVEDVNDNGPEFPTSQISLYIRENSAIGSSVGVIEAIDPDAGINAKVDYSIIDGADAGAFRLQMKPSHAALITTLTELDYEGAKRQYTIVVRARSFHLFSDATVTIHVQDVNDNLPLLSDFTIVFNNFKNYFPTGPIGKIPAHDPDEYDELKYRFTMGNRANILHLDENTGLISLDSRLNSDVPTDATLQVSVSDGINRVRATCRLHVRLVTDDMLFNSITVRLDNIDQTAFLSPLYDLFLSALATIIPTTEDNIFIINVQDDTDVSAKILNVSFSVRSGEDAAGVNVFHTPQFLKERVYLQRVLLGKLSTVQVLPFDDNLCVREPCLNFERCVSILQFGNASAFVSSTAMLFRPIRPINAFMCECPKGFSGLQAAYLCDTEVNLCYSSPCQSNGTCVQHEGAYSCQCPEGFTGKHCEIDKSARHYSVCPAGVCKGANSRCLPLIRGGFRCEQCLQGDRTGDTCRECSKLEHHTPLCGLRTRSFQRTSFLMFPSLRKRHRFTISLRFATRERNAILFYNGRYNEQHDFVALEVVEGQLRFSFSLGSLISRVAVDIRTGVSDGNWHYARVDYFNRTATLSVGEDCDTEVSLKFGKKIANYSCAARTSHQLEERCRDVTESCHRLLDLTGPLQLGGVPSLPTTFPLASRHFHGCISDVHIDREPLDLNDFVWNNGTMVGCPQKRHFCQPNICKHGGTCVDAWGTYHCVCPSNWGGKDCSQEIGTARNLLGSGYIAYSKHGLPSVRFPWYNGISFRTRKSSFLLMSINIGDSNVVIKIVDGYIHYIHPERTAVLDDMLVTDGEWHYLETRWLARKLIITLDYGQIQKAFAMGDWVLGKSVGEIVVGGKKEVSGSGTVVREGFVGCVKNVQVGSQSNSQLDKLQRSPVEYGVQKGCVVSDPCRRKPCPEDTSVCRNVWQQHTCACNKGHIGARCHSICDRYNPCHASAQCVLSPHTAAGYTCRCPAQRTGPYCEQTVAETCPQGWWGHPTCGPCDCPARLGFKHGCDKTTGECHCKENYYRPAGSDHCLRCACYSIGSYGASCHPVTGQCRCRGIGITGRRCDACLSRFAEVTKDGCQAVLDGCPHIASGRVRWPHTVFDQRAGQACPAGSSGLATRYCSAERGWGAVDWFNCSADSFGELRKQLKLLDSGALKMNTFVAKNTMSRLRHVTNASSLYGSDVDVTLRLMQHVLRHEIRQTGLNLTHTQDRNFIQNIVSSAGAILAVDLAPSWAVIHNRSAGLAELMWNLEAYSKTLASNMPQLFMQPFDMVHPNIVIGLDYIALDNLTTVTIPKYNNKVAKADMFDKDSRVMFQAASLQSSLQNGEPAIEGRQMVVSYVMYRTIGNLLPLQLHSSVRKFSSTPVAVNTPVITLNILHGNRSVEQLTPSMQLRLKQQVTFNRTSPQCVYWKSAHSVADPAGHWSTDGCHLVERPVINGENYVTCECNHLSSFAVVMDMSSIEYMEHKSLQLQIVKYTGFAMSLLCLVLSFLILCCLRGLHSNANSIHINLVFVIFASHLIFVIGVDRVESKLSCTAIAIVLHYFFVSTSTWMFVETLHLYRMMTEIRNINQGSMKFYYIVGYVVPGIIVGLAVGLDTDGYGNSRFCWLKTSDLLIWSFAGPILVMVTLNLAVFIMALRVSFIARKRANPDFNSLKIGMLLALMLLLLLGVSWLFAIFSFNNNMITFQYLFIVFTCLQGLFIIIAYVICNKMVNREVKYTWYRLQGLKGLDDSISPASGMLSRSALSYQNNSSLEGGLNRVNVGISTTSTTSRSTSKSSGGTFRPDGYLHQLSSSTSTGPNATSEPVNGELPRNAGIAPYGYKPWPGEKAHDDPDTGEMTRKANARRHRRQRRTDSDSDSDLSDPPDLNLASSHSSDDDDEDENFDWGSIPPKPLKPAMLSPTKRKPSHHAATSPTKSSDTDVTKPSKLRVYEKPPPYAESQSRPGILKSSKSLLPASERAGRLPVKFDGSTEKLARERVAVLAHNGSITSESELHV